jgi:hypothetical protein
MREPEQWQQVLKLVGRVLWEYMEQWRQVLGLMGRVLWENWNIASKY